MKLRSRAFLIATMMPLLASTSIEPARADRMLIWNVVALKCLRHLAKAEAPIPCDFVDVSEGEDRGVAVLKDFAGVARMLAIPTRRVTGIEDPALLEPDAPNYFADAWAARAQVERRLRRRLPRENVAIAVDSQSTRDQDQLILAVDCVDEMVATRLREDLAEINDRWSAMGVELKGRRYWARRLDSVDLAGTSPFRVLESELPDAGKDMGKWSLAAIGADFGDKPGFILLADHVDGNVGGRASELQDRDCAIATREP